MTKIQLSEFYKTLLKKRKQHRIKLPVKEEVIKFINDLMQFLFPHFSHQIYYNTDELEGKTLLLQRNLKYLVSSLKNIKKEESELIAEKFFANLPLFHELLWKDAEAIFKGDPAAGSVDEVITAYPGFLAIAVHRFAHKLYELRVPLLPRIMSEYAHQVTGIDIHPGAKIGKSFFIDHGTGIVIGETTQIGNNVKIYQGVTLGALSVDKELTNKKRHPTIEDHAVIYSNAVILGGNTIIGKGSTIGGSTWITKSIPPHSIVYHKNEVSLKNEKSEDEYLDYCI